MSITLRAIITFVIIASGIYITQGKGNLRKLFNLPFARKEKVCHSHNLSADISNSKNQHRIPYQDFETFGCPLTTIGTTSGKHRNKSVTASVMILEEKTQKLLSAGELNISDDPILIGRGNTIGNFKSKLILPELNYPPERTSRMHCTLSLVNDYIVLTDCHSSGKHSRSIVNGRLFSGNRIEVPTEIEMGDYIMIVKPPEHSGFRTYDDLETFGNFSDMPTNSGDEPTIICR